MARSIAAGILIIIGIGATACSEESDVKAVRAIVENVRVVAERKDFDRVIEQVTDDYTDNTGNKKQTLKPRLERMFGIYDRLEIRAAISKIEKAGNSARALAKVKVDGFRGSQKERLFGSPFAARDLQIDFEKRGGDWKIVGSSLVSRRGLF